MPIKSQLCTLLLKMYKFLLLYNSKSNIFFCFLNSAMKPEFLNLFRELCEEQVMLYIDPEGIKAKKKQRKIDFEVSDLRLKLANSMGKNVVLSNREIRLLR